LQQKLEQKESRVNRCTYGDKGKDENTGYLYQQIFSCRTCYEELISEKLNQIKNADDPLFEEASKFQSLAKEDQNTFLQ
jgi:hypothetical protein